MSLLLLTADRLGVPHAIRGSDGHPHYTAGQKLTARASPVLLNSRQPQVFRVSDTVGQHRASPKRQAAQISGVRHPALLEANRKDNLTFFRHCLAYAIGRGLLVLPRGFRDVGLRYASSSCTRTSRGTAEHLLLGVVRSAPS